MLKLASVSVLVALICAPAAADGTRYSGYRYPAGFYLPPERHVIELVVPPYSGRFMINGARFTAKTDACARWAAGERIKLIAGDWNGRCIDAAFYNFRWRGTCEMWCGW